MKHEVSKIAPPRPRRYLALWWPLLPIDRVRMGQNRFDASADAPLAIVAKQRGVVRLVMVDRSLPQLKPGLTLSEARLCVPGLVAQATDAAADTGWLLNLAGLCERYTPLVSLNSPDGVTLDITGCEHLFGGEAALIGALCQQLRNFNVQPQTGIAATPSGAWALARFAFETGLQSSEADMLRGLPVEALKVDDELTISMRRSGFNTLGALDELSAVVLTGRFGEDVARRLRKLLGQDDERIIPLRPIPKYFVQRRFAEPVLESSAIVLIITELIVETVAQLEQRGFGGKVFRVSLFRSDGDIRRLDVSTGRASRDVVAISRLFDERLASLSDPLDPGFGFDMIRLEVTVVEPLAALQHDFDDSSTADDRISELIDRLAVRLGAGQIRRFMPRDSHNPVRAATTIPAQTATPNGNRWPQPEEVPTRPILMYNRPQPIETMAGVPDGPPLRFKWRRIMHEVISAEGPERIAPEWWRQQTEGLTRDYYRVENTDGQRFWLFREGLYGSDEQPRWYLHGLFA